MGLFGKKKDNGKVPENGTEKVRIKADTNRTRLQDNRAGAIELKSLNCDMSKLNINGLDIWMTLFCLTPYCQEKIKERSDEAKVFEDMAFQAINDEEKKKFLKSAEQAYGKAMALYPLTEFLNVNYKKGIPEDLNAKPVSISINVVENILKRNNGKLLVGRTREVSDDGKLLRVNDIALDEIISQYYNLFEEATGERPFNIKLFINKEEGGRDNLGSVSRTQATVYGDNQSLYIGCDAAGRNATLYNPNFKNQFYHLFRYNNVGQLVEPAPKLIASKDCNFSLVFFGKKIVKLDHTKHPVTGEDDIWGYDFICAMTSQPIIRGIEDIKVAYKLDK